ncbi:hypothetical protein [Thalassovita sp.]|uniref:phage tail terminator protein n=1 Tax=Thalassovita sp. TaxID=1979401 RepID=UPI002B2754B0|nr:hypothetical protein [Thalassovita sp.]
MLDAVQTRLAARIPDLAGRVHDAADFTEMLRRGGSPTAMPAAYIMPAAMIGRQPGGVTGLFVQEYTESISVVLVFGSTEPRATRAFKRLRPFIFDVIEAIAGWTPGGTAGVYQLARGAVLGVGEGRLTYQLDFTIFDQLRIAT